MYEIGSPGFSGPLKISWPCSQRRTCQQRRQVHYQRRSHSSTQEDSAALDGHDRKVRGSASDSGNLASEVADIGDNEVHECAWGSDTLDEVVGSGYNLVCGRVWRSPQRVSPYWHHRQLQGSCGKSSCQYRYRQHRRQGLLGHHVHPLAEHLGLAPDD